MKDTKYNVHVLQICMGVRPGGPWMCKVVTCTNRGKWGAREYNIDMMLGGRRAVNNTATQHTNKRMF